MVEPFSEAHDLKCPHLQGDNISGMVRDFTNAKLERWTNHKDLRFLDRIQPWVHYVPVQVDLSDLHDALLFFRGDLYGEGSHHELARKIAHEGREWAKRFWRKEDMTAYAFRYV